MMNTADQHPGLSSLVSSYPILSRLAAHLTTWDLFRLSLTNRTTYACILASRTTFDALKRACLCDGHGIEARKTFQGETLHNTMGLEHKHTPRPLYLQCDTDPARVRPCENCTVNVCRHCRFIPRACPRPPQSKPHLNPRYYSAESLMAMCPECDDKMECEVQRKFPDGAGDLCDCNLDERWICHRCRCKEQVEGQDYYRRHVVVVFLGELPGHIATKSIHHGIHNIAFFCSCGAHVPQETRIRCGFCKRRHTPEENWSEEGQKEAERYMGG